MSRCKEAFVSLLLWCVSPSIMALPGAGLWEHTVRYEVQGEGQSFPAYTKRDCLNDAQPFPRIEQAGLQCQARLKAQRSEQVVWVLDCSSEWEVVQGVGRLNYRGLMSEGVVFMQILGPSAPPTQLRMTLNGRRLGTCR